MSPKLVVSSQFDFSQVDFSKESDVNLDVVLTAPEEDGGEKRIPLYLILTVDCSGSMDGAKMNSVKSTILKLLEHVTENDVVGIVGFSDNAWDIVPPLPMNSTNRDAAKKAVQAMHVVNGTNIEAALYHALEKAAAASGDQVSRIILLSDGNATTGAKTAADLITITAKMAKEISMSTFGYGNDYNPEVLASMATAGRGNHFYIQNDTDCRSAFALELGGLLSLYGQDIKVTLSMSGTMAVDEFLSGYEATQTAGYRGITGGKLTYTIPDIFFGEKKHALLRVKVPQASEAVCARKTKICDVSVDYLDVASKSRVTVEGTVKIQYVKPGKVASEPNKEVKDQLFVLEAAKKQASAKQMMDQGNLTGARTILQEAQVWASGSGTANASLVASNFSSLLANTESAHAYRSVGSKMFASYSTSYVTARGASSDTLDMSYLSKRQKNVMSSFASPVTGDSVTSSTLVVSAANSILNTTGIGTALPADPDKEEDKA